MTKTGRVMAVFLLLCSATLIATGGLKIVYAHEFLLGIIRVGLIPEALRYAASEWIPWFEVVLGIGLLNRTFRQSSAILTGMFGIGIVAYAALALSLGNSADCGCLGAFAGPGTWWPHFVAGAMFVSAVVAERFILDGTASRRVS